MANQIGNLSPHQRQVTDVPWPETAREIAYRLLTYDISPLPVQAGSKKVLTSWKRFQGTGPSLMHVANFFMDDNRNVAAMCGPPSKNLFVVDVESRRRLDSWLKKLDYPETWIVETGRGGHIYLRSPFPVAYRKLKDAEIRGANSYVLAPGSIHASGKRYSFINFTPKILELGDEDIKDFPVPLERGEVHPNLPRLARTLMRSSDDCGYGGRGRKEFAIVMSLVGAGFNEELIFHFFENYLYQGNKFSERGPTYLKHMLKKARKFIGQNEERKRWIFNAGYTFAYEFEWPNKRTATTDRNVLLAHLVFAYRFGRLQEGNQLEYGASQRDLAEEAGYHRRTVKKSTRRLIELGVVKLFKAANSSLVTRYTVNMDPFKKKVSLNTHSHGTPNHVCEWGVMTPNHDVWRTRSGKTKHLIYVTLRENEDRMRFTELVKKTGKGNKTVARNLAQMEGMGLIEKNKRYYCVVKSANFDAIAKRMGTHGKAEKQKNNHRIERILQSKRLAQHNDKYSKCT